MDKLLKTEVDRRGVAYVTLNRPDVRNAFNDALIESLHESFAWYGNRDDVRAIVLAGAGKSFSAGADLNWMRKAAEYSEEQNRADARKLSDMLHILNTCPKPTIGLVHGAAFGGGVGLVAACDMAFAVSDTKFSLSEVRLGLTPATISPYVIAKIGAAKARRFFLTAERFDAATAEAIGLINGVVEDDDDLHGAAETVLQDLLQNAPGAIAAAKDLIYAVAGKPNDSDLRDDTARRIAARRASDEGKAGIRAFLEKSPPPWRN